MDRQLAAISNLKLTIVNKKGKSLGGAGASLSVKRQITLGRKDYRIFLNRSHIDDFAYACRVAVCDHHE